MSERELLNLWGVGDRLIADVAKPSHTVDKIFCLVLPTDSVNCCLLDYRSLRIVGAAARTYKTNKAPAVACRSPLRY